MTNIIKLLIESINNVTDSEFNDTFEHGSMFGMLDIINHRNPKTRHINKALEHPNEIVRATAASSPHGSVHTVTKALKDFNLIEAALKSPYINSQHLETLLYHPDEDIRARVAVHPKLTNNHAIILSKDPSAHVRATLAEHTTSKKAIDNLVNDPNEYVRSALAERHLLHGLNQSHINKLTNDSHRYTRITAQEALQQKLYVQQLMDEDKMLN